MWELKRRRAGLKIRPGTDWLTELAHGAGIDYCSFGKKSLSDVGSAASSVEIALCSVSLSVSVFVCLAVFAK